MSSPRSPDGRRRVYVAVVGGNVVDDETTAIAETIGRLLAEAGAIVVTGGRTGVAEAASRGARAAGGLTIGLLPGHDRDEGNAWLSVALVTGLGDTRNALVALNGDAVIALDGEFGTLSEIALALVDGRPVVALGSWELHNAHGDPAPIVWASSPAEAVAEALGAVDR